MDAVTLIQKHEGCKLVLYVDTTGKASIGYGRNLSEKGITPMEALMLFQDDYTEVYNRALGCDWFRALNEPRQAVILDMGFNMGWAGVLNFRRMIEYLQAGKFESAADEMVYSEWAREVPTRAAEDAAIMRSGEWPAEV